MITGQVKWYISSVRESTGAAAHLEEDHFALEHIIFVSTTLDMGPSEEHVIQININP